MYVQCTDGSAQKLLHLSLLRAPMSFGDVDNNKLLNFNIHFKVFVGEFLSNTDNRVPVAQVDFVCYRLASTFFMCYLSRTYEYESYRTISLITTSFSLLTKNG